MSHRAVSVGYTQNGHWTPRAKVESYGTFTHSCINVVICDYNKRQGGRMTEKTRPISWIKAARKDFEDFPFPVQTEANRALTVAAEGHKAENVKPLKGFDSGTMEIVLRHRGDAFRVIYAVQIGEDL